MKTIAQIIRKTPVSGDIGIEIETEGSRIPNVDTTYWKSVADGSLRGESMEYVLKHPIPHVEVVDALEQLNKKFKDNSTRLDFSFRTSVHVHLNVGDLTGMQYLNTLYTALLLENPMMNYCGNSRMGNRFCLRVSDAEGSVAYLSSIFENIRAINTIDGNVVRYSAINYHATRKFGSIEFRGMRGTMDLNVLTNWCNAIYAIKQFALTFESPLKIQEFYESFATKYEFLVAVFGRKLADIFNYDLLDYDLSTCYSLTMSLPYFVSEETFTKPLHSPDESDEEDEEDESEEAQEERHET